MSAKCIRNRGRSKRGVKMTAFSNGGGGYGRDFRPREMHQAVCAECNKECQVPFKPTEGKPVYCRDCYKKKKGY